MNLLKRLLGFKDKPVKDDVYFRKLAIEIRDASTGGLVEVDDLRDVAEAKRRYPEFFKRETMER